MVIPSVRVVAVALVLTLAPAQAAAAQDFAAERRAMVDEITATVRETRAATGKQTFDERVLVVMGQVPRHAFVPADQLPYAYRNRPLPIGHGQTISQPYIVALMTDLARVAHLAQAVYSIEIVEPLGLQAKERLQKLGYDKIQVRLGDGYHGWAEHAPYDAILVTAAASHIPPPLIRQLKPGGRMVIPVGAAFMVQQLMLVEKNLDGTVSTRQVLPVRFVPLTGQR
jgi:protein-L-isoaspartate(D-aspartate) O-methyltransferase